MALTRPYLYYDSAVSLSHGPAVLTSCSSTIEINMPFSDNATISSILKLLVVSAIGGLLALGLCGIDAKLHPAAAEGGGVFAIIGAVIGLPSELGLVVALLALAIFGVGRLILKLRRK